MNAERLNIVLALAFEDILESYKVTPAGYKLVIRIPRRQGSEGLYKIIVTPQQEFISDTDSHFNLVIPVAPRIKNIISYIENCLQENLAYRFGL